MVIVDEETETGWWFVKKGNAEGWCPSDYLERAAGKAGSKPAISGGAVKPPKPGKPTPAAAGASGTALQPPALPGKPKPAASAATKPAVVPAKPKPKPAIVPAKPKPAVAPAKPKPAVATSAKPSLPSKVDAKGGATYKVIASHTAETSEEISLKKGDKAEVIEKTDDWWFIRVNGKEGW